MDVYPYNGRCSKNAMFNGREYVSPTQTQNFLVAKLSGFTVLVQFSKYVIIKFSLKKLTKGLEKVLKRS